MTTALYPVYSLYHPRVPRKRWVCEGRTRVLPEHLLARLWRAKAGKRLTMQDGRLLRVLYPGRPAPGHGPDFREALVELDGERVRGDVELHRTAAGWRAHGHHRDPAYDRVVLHVLGKEEAAPDADLPPAVVLPPEPAPDPPPAPVLLASLRAEGDEQLRAALTTLGRNWFAERTASIGAQAAAGIEQALYARLLSSLAGSANKRAAEQLARALPFCSLRETGSIEARLLTASGLLPGSAAALPPGAWSTLGVRPHAHPERRLRGAAALLERHLPDLAPSLAAAVDAGARPLVQALTVAGPPALIGASTARRLAVDCVLPSLAADAAARGDAEFARKCRRAFEAIPPIEPNTLTREAWRLVRPSEPRLHGLSACRMQGLLHAYRTALA